MSRRNACAGGANRQRPLTDGKLDEARAVLRPALAFRSEEPTIADPWAEPEARRSLPDPAEGAARVYHRARHRNRGDQAGLAWSALSCSNLRSTVRPGCRWGSTPATRCRRGSGSCCSASVRLPHPDPQNDLGAVAGHQSEGHQPPAGGDLDLGQHDEGGARPEAERHPLRHLRCIAERGRMGWQRASGYNWRALGEADITRWKCVIGGGLRSQTEGRQATEEPSPPMF